jgi:xanthine dehydrogenase accessory factor
LGYRIVVLDERAEMVTVEHFPQADVLLTGPIGEQLSNCLLTEQTYAVQVTPHHSQDKVALAVLAEHHFPYVGLLGSRRRTQATSKRAQRSTCLPSSWPRYARRLSSTSVGKHLTRSR